MSFWLYDKKFVKIEKYKLYYLPDNILIEKKISKLRIKISMTNL